MRKIRKIISLISVATLTASLLPPIVSASDDGIYADYDFEDCEIGSQPDGWVFSMNGSSSASIQKDTVSNSKALKLVIGKDISLNTAVVNFDDTTEGIIKVSYDMRMENHSRWSLDNPGFGSARSGDTLVSFNALYSNSWIGYGAWGGTGNNSGLISNLHTNKEYINVVQYYDFENKTFTQYIDGTLKSAGISNDWVFQNDAVSIDNIIFSVRANSNASGTSTDGTNDNNGVYWIDNLKVERPALEIQDSTIADGAENISIKTESVDLTFSDIIDGDSLNFNTVQVYCGDVRMAEDEYSLSANNNIVTLSFKEILQYYTTYKIVVTTALNANTKYSTLRENYTLSFKTFDPSTLVQNYNSDFENEAVGETPRSGWTFELQNGSAATVEVDPTDENATNKALKLVIGPATTPTTAKFTFDETISDRVTVAFDFKAENNTRSFYDGAFGTIRQNNNAAAKGITYKSNLLYFWGQNNTDNVTLMTLGADKNYHRFEFDFDMVNKTYKLKVDGVTKTFYRGEDFGFFNNVTALNNLFFSAWYNSGTGPNGATADDNGIYWIDNVVVEPTSLKVTGQSPEENAKGWSVKKNTPSIAFNNVIDFDNVSDFVTVYANDEEVPADAYAINAEEKKISIVFNDLLAYETEYKIVVSKDINSNNRDLLQMKEDYILTFTTIDEESASIIEPILYENSEAVKVTNSSPLTINFDDITEGKVIITYKYRAENHVANSNLSEFGTVYGKNSTGASKIAVRTIIYNNSMLTYYEPTDTTNTNTGSITNSEEYHTRQYIIDMTTRTFKIVQNGTQNSRSFAFWGDDIQSLNRLTFKPSGSGSVYWIDDITVEYEHLKITESDPKDRTVRVVTTKTPVIQFSEEINTSTVNDKSVRMYKDGTEMSADEFAFTFSGDKLLVKPTYEMTDGSEYKIWLSHKIAGKSGLSLMSPQEITFTANLLDPFKITKQIRGTTTAGQVLEAVYDVENISNSDEWLAVVLICYDKDKSIVGVSAVNKNVLAGETVKFTPSITVPENTGSASIYVWKSKSDGTITMNPVSESYEVK